MNRTQKMAILTQMLQGNLAKLQALKQVQDEETIVFVVDNPPEGWYGNPDDERPVLVNYQLGDENFIEYLTNDQMRAKTKGAIFILPHNGRSLNLVKQFEAFPPLIEE